jgi:RNA polymerase sigma-70 factor (ECF subfamily)
MNGGGAAGSDRRYDLALAAMASMKPADREALQLVLWDGLTHLEAAKVLGCSVNAFELRYRRARNAARAAVDEMMPANETTVNTSTSPVIPLATEGTP